MRGNLFGILFRVFVFFFVVLGGATLVFADTNGVWHHASDVRGGVLGGDESFPGFILNSTLSLKDSGKITDVPTPINGSDAVNKAYVDVQLGGGSCSKEVCTWARGRVCPPSWMKLDSGELLSDGFRLDPNFNSSDDDKMGSFCCRSFSSFPAGGEVCGLGKDICIVGNFYNSTSNSTHYNWYCSGVNGGNDTMCSKLK